VFRFVETKDAIDAKSKRELGTFKGQGGVAPKAKL